MKSETRIFFRMALGNQELTAGADGHQATHTWRGRLTRGGGAIILRNLHGERFDQKVVCTCNHVYWRVNTLTHLASSCPYDSVWAKGVTIRGLVCTPRYAHAV